MKPAVYKVVFDTNTFISAFVYGGRPEEAYRLALQRKITLITSPAIMQETARILKEKINWDRDKIEEVLRQIAQVAKIVRPKKTLKVIEDESDNRILEAAVKGKADFIVSGDKHLLSLKKFENLSIIKAADLILKI
jgi:putative PIN family toxin of toxin-antitoxin system